MLSIGIGLTSVPVLGRRGPAYDFTGKSPSYIELLANGPRARVPDNVRTGLPSTTATGGGFAVELQIAVTGTAGSAALTSTEPTKVAGLGASGFEAALNSTDGTQDFFASVISNNGSDTITLDRPLTADFSGVLMSKYDASLGQHMTSGGTRALARILANSSAETEARGRILAGTWLDLPASHNTVWAKNAALTAYGSQNSAAPLVQTSLQTAPGAGNMEMADGWPVRPTTLDQRGVTVGTHLAGHGFIGTFAGGGRDVVLSFWLGAWRASTTLAGVAMSVAVKNNGVTVMSGTYSHILRRIRATIKGAGTITVEVTNTDGQIYYIDANQAMLREAGVDQPLLGAGEKAVFLGDSWGEFYDGLLPARIAALTGGTVVNHSKGGMTTEWALAWYSQYVRSEKPAVVFIHFYTNDLNNNQNTTFTAPDGSTKALWPNGLTAAQAQERWRVNINTLIALAQADGIRAVVLKPGGSAASGQTQTQANASWALDKPLPLDWKAKSTEIAAANAFSNRYGKYAGYTVWDLTNLRTMVAQGATPIDPWKTTDGSVTVTPV